MSVLQVQKELIDRGHARRMGHLENYFALLQRQELYSNFSVYCSFNRSIELNQLKGILREIFLKHPILVHTIIPKNYPNHKEYYSSEEYLNNPCPQHDYMQVLPQLGLDDILLNNQIEYQDILEKIKNQYTKDNYKITNNLSELVSTIHIPINHTTRPNWGFISLPTENHDGSSFEKLIFVSNHCCADAITGINIFQEISERLNNGTKMISDSLIYNYEKDYKEMAKIPEPITNRIDYRPPLTSLPQFLLSAFIKSNLNYRSDAEITRKINPQNPQDSFQSIINFPTEELNDIRAAIKEHNCSVTGYLQTCFFLTMKSEGLFDSRKYNEFGFDISIPNNTRKLLPTELADEQYKYGANVGGLHYSYLIYSFDENKFWDLCSYYSNVLKSADYLSGLGSLMLDFVVQKKNVDAVISDAYLGNKRGGIILSNVGMFPQKNDTYEITDLMFMQNVGALNFTYVMNVCSTNLGGMNICLSAAEGTFKDRVQFNDICHKLKATIERMKVAQN